MSNKAFLICPVRAAGDADLESVIELWVAYLEEKGWSVHWPSRDTDQIDPNGYRICRDNVDAIAAADMVFLWWDGKSQGSLFDLGAAFALGKPLTVLQCPPVVDGKKSFQAMAQEWSRR